VTVIIAIGMGDTRYTNRRILEQFATWMLCTVQIMYICRAVGLA